MQNLLQKTRTFLTPTASSTNIHDSANFRTEKQAERLFQKTDPLLDGEDCLYDCASCTESLPRKWEIDEDDKLYGEVKGWETHLVVGTGKTDWVRDVTDEKGSLMSAVGKIGQELSNGKLMLSASDMPPVTACGDVHDSQGSANDTKHSDYPYGGRTRCIVLPRWEVVDGVGMEQAKWLLEDVISKGSTNSTPLARKASALQTPEKLEDGEMVVGTDQNEIPEVEGLSMQDNKAHSPSTNGQPHSTATQTLQGISTPIPAGVTTRPLAHKAIILMCSHGTRDWRCGKSAPILRRELIRHLRPLGLYRDFDDDRPDGVGIYYINHVGGHKYSANVMVYRRGENGEANQGIWLARVRPEDCENIVRYTVLQGKVVKPERQLRGGFDRERGVLSW